MSTGEDSREKSYFDITWFRLKFEGREGVRCKQGLPFLEAGKLDFVHWVWDSWNKNNRKREWDLNLGNTGWDCGIWAGIRKK